jgi:3',5'-cyclic AMP phosphodiesterase CpdA
MPIKLAHFSDIHLTTPRLGWGRRDVFSKKLTGWVNVKMLGRGRRFRFSTTVVDALVVDLKSRGYDRLVFSGDATKMAFETEMKYAAERLCVADPAMPPGVCVPGNHDYYIRHDFLAGRFEKHFAPWLAGTRVDEDIYPFAVECGHCWLVCLNSAKPNFWAFDAGGRVGAEQLIRLRTLCDSLPAGPRILVTHYPLMKSDRTLEIPTRRLRDHRAVTAVAADCGVSLWLHGHIHKGYVLEPGPDLPFPVICAGSATQEFRWSYNEYVIDGWKLTMTTRTYDRMTGQFADGGLRTVELGPPA